MTRKHFEKIAKDINERAMIVFYSNESTDDEKWYGLKVLEHLQNDFISTFSKFNDNFDAKRFRNACGIQELRLELV
tara:strand:+ start:156 stop:383 length:228 start_codon:yes stop_codon:yes gene_type:complete